MQARLTRRSTALWLALTASFALVAGVGAVAAQKPSLSDIEKIEITAKPLSGFNRPPTSRTKFGRLEWRGGLILTSSSEHFGGLSGFVLDQDGRGFLAISDAGIWLKGTMTYDGRQPSGIENATIGPILARNGTPVRRLRDRDAEGMALVSGSVDRGTVLISFEGNHRIGRFGVNSRGISAPNQYLNLPPETRRMGRNTSFESVSVLRGGRHKGSVIAFSERLTNKDGNHTGWIWINGTPRALHITDPGGFDITDTTPLPDGGLLVLERRFRWTEGVKMRIRLLNAGEITPGATLEGETLFEANMSYEIDNMEGISAHRDRNGETVITVVSDNNFNSLLQRTQLLQFTLSGSNTASADRPQ